MVTRIYLVKDKKTSASRLVRATHPSHALRHIAEDMFSVDIASQDDLVEHLAAGVVVEKIGEEQIDMLEQQ